MTWVALVACLLIMLGLMIEGIWQSAVGRLPLGMGLVALSFVMTVPSGLLACNVDPNCY